MRTGTNHIGYILGELCSLKQFGGRLLGSPVVKNDQTP